METRRRAALLELVNRTLHSERDNVQLMAEAKEARLKERISELEKENSELLEQIFAMEGKNARLLEWPSTSHASEFPNIPREVRGLDPC